MFTIDARRVYLIMTTGGTLSGGLLFTLITYYYVVVVGLNPLQLVLVGTVLEAAAFLFEVPTGVLADSFSRRLSIIIGTGLMGLGTLGQIIVPDFGVILLCQVVQGVAYTFTSGADNAWLADEVGEEAVGPILLFSSQLCQLAGIVGIVSSVGLGLIDLRLPFLVSGLLSLGLTMFLIVAMPERGFVRPTPHERASWGSMVTTFQAGLAAIWGRPILILLLAIEFFAGAASEGYDRLWQAHLLTNFSFPAFGNWSPVIWFGLIGLGGQMLSFAALQFVRRRLNTTNRRRVVQVFFIMEGLSIVGRFVFALAGNFEIALATVWARGVIGTLAEPIRNTWLTQLIPSRVRATVLSMNSQANALGQVAVGPGVGALGNAFGIRLAIVTTGLLLLPNLALYTRLASQAQPDETATETPSLV